MLFLQKKDDIHLPDVKLEGFRVDMRPPRHEDWPHWVEVRMRNYRHLKPFEPSWPKRALSEDFFRRRLLRQYNEWQADKGNFFLIFKKGEEDSGLIGGMNINNICRGAAQYASLGYWIDERYEGQGYMAEALRLTTQYCFDELGLHRIHAACLDHNERSKELLLRAGFREEGVAEKYMKIDGQWQDHILYGLTAENRKKL